jgi:ribosomal protein S18 acetylase RimI-like enzyme
MIRKMKVSDIDFILEVGKREEEFRVSKKLGGFWSKDQLTAWINSKDDVMLIAEEKEIVGFIMSSLHKPTGKATFENMWVNPNFRRKGLATKMTQIMIKKLKENGAEYICGMSKVENESIINFLMKEGFDKGYPFFSMGKKI